MKKIVLCALMMSLLLVCGPHGVNESFAATPPNDFLNKNIYAFAPGTRFTEGGKTTLREFITIGIKGGKWSKVDKNQWIYRLNKIDQVTNKRIEMTFSFVEYDLNLTNDPRGIVLERIAFNREDLSSSDVYGLFNQIYSGLPGVKARLEQDEAKWKEQQIREREVEKEAERQKAAALENERLEQERLEREADAKRHEAEKLERQKEFQRLLGKHEITYGKGMLEIKDGGNDTILFSITRELPGGRICKITDAKAQMNYDDYKGFEALFKPEDDKNDCGIKIEFMKKYSFINIWQDGHCRAYCDRAATFNGRFAMDIE